MDDRLGIGDAHLYAPVVVGIDWYPVFDRALHESVADRIFALQALNREWAEPATELILSPAYVTLRFAEVRQNRIVVPALVPGLAPIVEVGHLAAIVAHTIDSARSS